ncbi:HAMP domain-containing protein [Bradyrhizobium sp. USDA 3051]
MTWPRNPGNALMSRLIQNLQIGTKLALASAFGVVLVGAMIASQVIGNNNVRHSNQAALAQQELVREATEAKLGIRGLQLAVRDMRLANNQGDLQKASELLLERSKALNGVVDSMLRLSHAPENRARMEKLKSTSADYLKGAQQNASVRSEAIAVAATDPVRAAKISEEGARQIREVTLPLATQLDNLTSEIADFAKHKSDEEIAAASQEMAVSERLGMVVGACAVLVLIGSWLMSFLTIARPIRALTVAMDKLAGGDFSVVLPGLGRKDEVGGVAAAVEKFKVVSEQKARQEAEAKMRQDQVAAEQRKADMRKLADSFEGAVGEIVDTVSSAATELEASASTLTSTAERAQELTIVVAAASEEARPTCNRWRRPRKSCRLQLRRLAARCRNRRGSRARRLPKPEPRPTVSENCPRRRLALATWSS